MPPWFMSIPVGHTGSTPIDDGNSSSAGIVDRGGWLFLTIYVRDKLFSNGL